jgi:small subunit ribosomal protein S9
MSKDIMTDAIAATETVENKPQIDDLGRSYATGRRKTSADRVWIKKGKGKITVNKKDIATYFGRPVLQMIINDVFKETNTEGDFDVICTVKGGGLSGQAGAIKHGIARALDKYNPTLHKTLRKGGYLTRDSRMVERKKPGKPKARKSFQFSKR